MATAAVQKMEIPSNECTSPSSNVQKSPLSISEVDFCFKRRKFCSLSSCEEECQQPKISGDSFSCTPEQRVAPWNSPLEHDCYDEALSSSGRNSTRKRKRRDVTGEDSVYLSSEHVEEPPKIAEQESVPTDSIQSNEETDTETECDGSRRSESMDRSTDSNVHAFDGSDHDGVDFECSPNKQKNRRKLYIEYWSRTDECKERKWDHLDAIGEKYGSAEEHIFSTTLNGRTSFLEPNMFPYDTPTGIEHWTLWHVNELCHEQIKQYVENWIDANAPHVGAWNYDDNPERSIDIFHVHVYFQVEAGDSVLQSRCVEELNHEMD